MIKLCTTVGDGVGVSTTAPDPKHVHPYRFATPDGEWHASGNCSMRLPVLDKDKGEEERVPPEGFGCLSLIEQCNQALDDGPVDLFRDAVGLRKVQRWRFVMDPCLARKPPNFWDV